MSEESALTLALTESQVAEIKRLRTALAEADEAGLASFSAGVSWCSAQLDARVAEIAPVDAEDEVMIAIANIVEMAELGDPFMQALQCELIRLYAAAGERRPVPLGGTPRRDSSPRRAGGFLEFLR